MTTAVGRAIELIFSGSEALTHVIGVTLVMSLLSSLSALLIGVPVGVLLGSARFPGRKIWLVLNRTLMGLPPVVCGLCCFLLFCGVGTLRHLHLLYTVQGMVIAQILLITPVVAGTMEPFIASIYPPIRENAMGMGLPRIKLWRLLLRESSYQIISVYLVAFSRAIAEVGAVSMVGGAIVFKTNVMTTAIMNYTNMGDFGTALALGLILLGIALLVNVLAILFQRRAQA